MKYRWANAILLSLLVGEIATGVLALASGSPDKKYLIDLHGIGGWAAAVVLIWKGQNIYLAFKGDRRLTPSRIAFLLLLVVLLTTLVTGVIWTFISLPRFLGISVLTWHLILGLGLVPILLWHLGLRRRGFPPLKPAEGRRAFLMLSAVGISGLVIWRGTDLLKGPLGLLGSKRRFTGSYEQGSFSGNAFPVTSWLFDNPGPIDIAKWSLRIDGLVERPMTIGYQELLKYSDSVISTIDCTGGWFSTQAWKGIEVARLLDGAKPVSDAASVTFWSTTGYYRRYAMSEARKAVLATHVGGEVLSPSHGFPLRVVGPGKRGFEWVKWVNRIEVNATGSWLQPPFPLQ